jgi:hypothetical protein
MSTILKGLNKPVVKRSKISQSYNRPLMTMQEEDSTGYSATGPKRLPLDI